MDLSIFILDHFLLPVASPVLLPLPAATQAGKGKAALLSNRKKNDKVITHAGIYGKSSRSAEKEDEITVEIDDKVRVKMVKNAILRNLTNEEAAKEAEAAKKAAKEAAKGGKAKEPSDLHGRHGQEGRSPEVRNRRASGRR